MADMSKATVVSICPFPVKAVKPGLTPAEYSLPASKDGKPVVLVVGGATFPVYLDSDRGSLRVPAPSFEVARSIVEDYCTSHLGYDKEDAMPGMFHVDGAYTVAEVTVKFKDELVLAKKKQDNWFIRLVKIADDEWNRTHRHAAISDMQRVACEAMGFTRDWLMKPNEEETVQAKYCPACSVPITNGPVICPNCKLVLNKTEYEKLKGQFATV